MDTFNTAIVQALGAKGVVERQKRRRGKSKRWSQPRKEKRLHIEIDTSEIIVTYPWTTARNIQMLHVWDCLHDRYVLAFCAYIIALSVGNNECLARATVKCEWGLRPVINNLY